MNRYMAFSWSPETPAHKSLARSLGRHLESCPPDWRCVFDTDGLLVYQVGESTRASRVYLLDRDAGVVLGKIFPREIDSYCASSEVKFCERATDRVLHTGGKHLVDHYWGRYVAFGKESGGQHTWVLRDPTGAIPCFISTYQGLNIVFSHVDDCDRLGLLTLSINWDHIAAYMWFDQLVTKDTGIAGVRQIHAGERISIADQRRNATFCWSPDRIHDARTVDDRQQAMGELRDVVKGCVAAWASCYDNVLHELSGGLDSSIVLACLSSAPGAPNIVCENFVTKGAEGDERFFARQAAEMAEVDLIETPIPSSNRSLMDMFESRKRATPAHTVFLPDTQPARERIAKANGIDAVFSGQGGDHFFQQSRTPQIAADYAWRNGIRPEILRVVSDTARFTRRPIWAVIGSVVKSGLLGRHDDPYAGLERPPLMSDAMRDALDPGSIRHPWVEAATGLPGTKQQQIFHIIDSQTFYYFPDHYADIVHPLMSQPIIELCLQIPSYVLTYGGVDRALAREAFDGMVPRDILSRTTKGATTGHLYSLLLRNLPFLRKFLLEGQLVAAELLDKRKTQAALTESSFARGYQQLFAVLDAARAEHWVRIWTGFESRVAA